MQKTLIFAPYKLELAHDILNILNILNNNVSIFNIKDIVDKISRPTDFKFGDYTFCTHSIAKLLKQDPTSIASNITANLEKLNHPWIKQINTIGAFVNISLNIPMVLYEIFHFIINNQYFNAFINENITDTLVDITKEKVMIEYSQPNTHKEFHVGHLRNVAIGDSLVRIFRYCGQNVIATNYPGDEGVHIAKCLWYMRQHNLQPKENEDKGHWLGKIYTQAVQYLESISDKEKKEQYNQEISQIIKDIEHKKNPYYELWKQTREWSLHSFYKIYEWLDVHFDHYFFQSEFIEESQRIVNEYLNKGIFEISEGAVGINLKNYDLGFVLLRKRDGNTLYATKDLALAIKKFNDFKIDRSIYIVAAEQTLHFKQVFKTLEIMGFKQAQKCYHLSYGLVILPKGKMSSREGTTIGFETLKENISKEFSTILQKYQNEWSCQEIEDTNKKLTIAAIKYGMLNTDPIKDVIFNLKDWTSFEGNSGPYLTYTYARIKSILRKAHNENITIDDIKNYPHNFKTLISEEEKDLVRYLVDFNEKVLKSYLNYKPSILTHYLYNLSKTFNRFYIQHPILKAANYDTKLARLALIFVTALILEKGLYLLGITPCEKM